MSGRYRWPVLWAGLFWLAGPLGAQAVAIHPIAPSVDVAPYSTTTQRFWVVNAGTQANQFGLFANVCTPFDLYCAWSNPFLGTIAPNDSVPVDVTFTAGHAGTSGTISFDARVNTNQSIRATKNFTVLARQETHLEVAAFNPGTAEERDLCLTVAVAIDAAYECGDLRLVHALPSVRARGTVRTPTLLYNSRLAHPFALVAATLSVLPHDVTNVTATLTVPRPGGDIVVSQGYPDTLFTASSVRKIVLGFDAGALPTGVYPYTLAATMSVAGTPDTVTASGTLIVVNWKTSPFGAGWWLAGYERIYPQGDGSLLWVGGDGSARHYTSADSGVYRAPGIDRPDSITMESGNFIRHLRSGARVEFAPDGRHFATSDRLGLVTFFHHDQYGQMVYIDPAGFGSLRYTFAYSSFTGPLETVTAPSVGGVARVVQRYVLGDGRILEHTDPDGTVVQFGFGSAAVPEQITSRTNRRGVAQSFAFDAVGKLVAVRVPLNAGDTAVTTFCPAESSGVVSTGCSSGPLHPDSAVTVMDGPRTDVTDVTTFRLDRFGAPTIVRDALGSETRLFRGNRDFPGLVTRIVHANGWVNDAFHDPKGLVTKLVQYAPLGPDRDAVTEYTWDPRWERVTGITSPEGNVVRFAYDTATGNRIWQEDGRGATSRADFTYYGTGVDGALLLSSVIHPADAQGQRGIDSVRYDGLGNVAETLSPVGAKTSYTRDAIGRVTATYSDITFGGAVRQRDSTVYDVMDRVTLASSFGPQVNPTGSPAATLETQRTWDEEGNLTRLARRADPDTAAIGTVATRWRYDLADRRVAEVDTLGRVDSTAYDLAGNVRAVVTRRGDTLRMSYDALNRLLSRAVPAVTYDSARRGIATLALPTLANPRYPFYPNTPDSGYRVAGDTEAFAYDEMGRLTSATNANALVTRTYFANGLVRAERQRVRTLAPLDSGGTFTRHDYTIGYAYDLDGRRTRLAVPGAVAPVVGGVVRDTVRFGYDPAMGALTSVTDMLGRDFTYGYDGRSAVTSLALPFEYTERFGYTLDGLLARDSVTNDAGVAIRRKRLVYGDARGKVTQIVDSVGFRDVVFSRYSGLGYVDSTFYTARRDTASTTTWTSSEKFTYDALANIVQSRTMTDIRNRVGNASTGAGRKLVYEGLTGRLVSDTTADAITTFEYDSAGNTRFASRTARVTGATREDRYSYYGADGRLRAADFRQVVQAAGFASPTVMAFEEYRYDALGRRVLVRARRQCDFVTDRPEGECNLGLVRRTVWDGTQELAEIQMPDSVGNNPVVQTETDTGFVALPPTGISGGQSYFDPNPYFGRVLYTHGLALDYPLSITRADYTDNPQQPGGNGGQGASRWAPFTIIPVWNDRGKADLYYFEGGRAPYCRVVSGNQRCVAGSFPFAWFAYDRALSPPREWHGTLVEDKADKAGTLYRRARYYEPATGRFTQEDPIGLAGGMNLYGYAGGDPVTYSDPFGLCPPKSLAEVLLCTGQLLRPAQGPLEIAGALVTAPLAGGMGMLGEGITTLGLGGRAVASGTKMARALGAAGEAASGLVKNTQRIPSATGTAAFRVPDGLTATTLSEVKNVAKLSLTNQLRDFATFARESGRSFELFVRSNTELSGPLQQFIKDNNIVLRILK